MIGYIFAIFIGFSLGLLGGGGSILTVPVLVYILGMGPKTSIALSLGIVGVTSLIGVFGHYRNKNINLETVILFAPSTMLGAFLGAYIASFISGENQLLIFGGVMLTSSVLMIRGRKESETQKMRSKLILVFAGFFVGIISGVVGVGGGFLIVPALVLLAGLQMREAVGTSLAVISLSSLTGFLGHAGHINIPWFFFVKFVLLSGIGILIGSKMVQFISEKKLKKCFGFFLILMGIFILAKNIN